MDQEVDKSPGVWGTKKIQENIKKNGYWLGKNWVTPKPTNGNLSLKTSIPFREKGRIGYDAVNNEVIQFNRHRVDESNCVEYWHGFVINNQPVPMKEEAKKIAKTLGYKGKKWI